MTARLTAHAGGAGGSGRAAAVLRAAVAVALAVDLALFVMVVASRLGFPYQLEWMTGSVLDHVERVRSGSQLYAEPSQSFIAYIYPPLYYWVGALFGGLYLACRLVSLVSALIQAVIAWRIAKDLGASTFWAIAGGALLLACFPYVGWWYDIERSDTLFGALALAMGAVLMRARSPRDHGVAGLLGGMAFLAKQQALFVVAGAAIGLGVLAFRDRKRLLDALFFIAAAVGFATFVIAVANARSGGWLAYYVLHIPAAHGLTWRLAIESFPHDLGRGLGLVAATVGMVVVARRTSGSPDSDENRRILLFVALLLSAAVSAVSSRLHLGGWLNVLSPWTSFACVAVVVLASRIEAWGEDNGKSVTARGLVAVVVIAQLGLWLYDPRLQTPASGALASTERFHGIVHELEQRGDVLVVSHAHITKAHHFQMSALADVARAEGHSPPDLVQALRDRRYEAIFDDARLEPDNHPTWWPAIMLEDVADLRAPLLANYFVARRIDDATARLPMGAPAMPRWVLLPRKKPLVEGDPQLGARHVAEIKLAQEHIPEGEIEALAAGAH